MESAVETVYPRSGWRRALEYIKLRLKRLPDTPHNIAIGIACGVFVTFTPLFGFHFFLAALCAWILRGNILASLLATFVGNPVTFPFIAAVSYGTGLWMLGRASEPEAWSRVTRDFGDAAATLWANLKALFTGGVASWEPVQRFFVEVFLPYLIGGLPWGIFFAVVFYFLSKPAVEAYQRRRRGMLARRFQELRARRKAHEQGNEG